MRIEEKQLLSIRIPQSEIRNKKPPGASSHAGRKPQENHPLYPVTAFPPAVIEGNCYAVSSDASTLAPRCSEKAFGGRPSAFSLFLPQTARASKSPVAFRRES